MPHTFNGVGTKYYGASDETEDGSYVTTFWAVFLWVPVFPLGSYRVVPQPGGYDYFLVSDKQYFVVHTLPIRWDQVWRTYAWAYGVVGSILILSLLLL